MEALMRVQSFILTKSLVLIISDFIFLECASVSLGVWYY